MEEEDRKLKKQKGLNRPAWWIVMREGKGGGGQASVRTKASVSRCVCLLLALCFSCAEFVPASTSCVHTLELLIPLLTTCHYPYLLLNRLYAGGESCHPGNHCSCCQKCRSRTGYDVACTSHPTCVRRPLVASPYPASVLLNFVFFLRMRALVQTNPTISFYGTRRLLSWTMRCCNY